MSMQVENKIDIYEVDGNEIPIGTTKQISVISHWNRDSLVVLKIGNKEYTVNASNLQDAIENATNWR